NVYYFMGRYSETESLFLEAIKIQRSKEINSINLAVALNNLAFFYKNRERYKEAESLYLEAIELRIKKQGASHPHIAVSLSQLGTLYRKTKRLEDAEKVILQA